MIELISLVLVDLMAILKPAFLTLIQRYYEEFL